MAEFLVVIYQVLESFPGPGWWVLHWQGQSSWNSSEVKEMNFFLCEGFWISCEECETICDGYGNRCEEYRTYCEGYGII